MTDPMTDQELIDQLIALGLVQRKALCWHALMDGKSPVAVFTTVNLLVRDWRVAGAIMELAIENKPMQVERWDESLDWAVDFGGEACSDHGSLPRAITEACIKLLYDVTR